MNKTNNTNDMIIMTTLLRADVG